VSAAVLRRALGYALAYVLAVLLLPAPAWGILSLEFGTAPALPALPALTLNGQAQTLTATMNNFSVSDTRLTKSGWNVTVNGRSGSGKSAVFAQYCPKAKCGSDSEGYVAGGGSLAANSLQLNSTGAAFSGGSGTTPKLECSSSCNVDAASAVKIASSTNGEFTWTSGGWSATSVKLTAPTTVRAVPSEEIYRLNVLWTLASGP
jgi:hypothetical protein